jgi:cellulose synthase/poly-beta-1,6-N-acetylglucosamine synthase-like glycosyltransferase
LFIDSDCEAHPDWIKTIYEEYLNDSFDACGGPDGAKDDFTTLQKAINYAMTAFIATGGFGNIHPGEDPDLTIRLWKLGYETQLISNAFVYHKRRISWDQFYKQVNKFGKCRPILNSWHPETSKITYWFPTCFIFGLALGLPVSIIYNNS